MHEIVGKILSISYESRQPEALVEIKDGSKVSVTIDNKFHPLFECGDDGLFEGSWSTCIDGSNNSIKLFFAELAFNNSMKDWELENWRKFFEKFSGSELWDFCDDSGKNERNYMFCLNFHLASFERFSALAVFHAKNKDIDQVETLVQATKVENEMIQNIAQDLNIDMSEINNFLETVNKETSFDMAYAYLESTLGKAS